MENEEYEFLGKPDISNMMSSDPNHDWEKHASRNEFKRGACMIFATDEQIEGMTEEEFPDWYKEKSNFYHFYDDWKKKFKGSEFLIHVVEKEMKIRKRMLIADFVIQLSMIKDKSRDIYAVIAEYKASAETE